MQLDKKYKDDLVQELRFASKKMNEADTIEKKLFFFSATYGITSRINKMSFSKELLLTDFILSQTYQLIFGRYNQIKGGEFTIPLDEAIFKKMSIKVAQMADRIEKNEPFYDILEFFITVGYSTNGAGYYLLLKEQLTYD